MGEQPMDNEMISLLSRDMSDRELHDRLRIASHQLAAMYQAGELDALPIDTRCSLSALALMLLNCSSDAFDLENAARVTSRERRRVPYWLRHFGL